MIRRLQHWRRSRPFWAGCWCLLSGVILTVIPGTGIKLLFIPGNMLWAGLTVGFLMLIFGLLTWFQPQLRYLLGSLVLLLSFASFVTSDFGGLFVGMLTGMIGASLAFAWTPFAPAAGTPASTPAAAITETAG